MEIEPQEEALLDRKLKSLLGKGPQDYRPEQWRSLRERLRLPLLYSGQYVAYCDHYEGEGEARRLQHREVLCAAESLAALNERLEQVLQEKPDIKQNGVQVSRVDPQPGTARGRKALLSPASAPPPGT
jgi:hypothetical protein